MIKTKKPSRTHKKISLFQLCLSVLLVTGLSLVSMGSAYAELPHLQTPKIKAPSLEGSVLKNDVTQPLYIALPKGYDKGNTRYPVVYFLHSYGAKPEQAKILAAQASNFIVVGVNGYNHYAGSFYACLLYTSPSPRDRG